MPGVGLPADLTSFVGRRREVAHIGALLRSRPLVTITGIGGMGKTRLVIRSAGEAASQFPDGVFYADLSAVQALERVPGAIAEAVGVRYPASADLVGEAMGMIGEGRCLLAIDHCEQAPGSLAPIVTRLLTCPNLAVLAGARHPLEAPGEHVHAIPPMGEDAVDLFLARAPASAAIDPADHAAISALCARLDGIPLAIELAAARLKVLSIGELLQRLDDRFGLLETPARGARGRRATLGAMVEWTYNSLSEDDRLLFSRLSVFRGNFDATAVEEVCSATPLRPASALDQLDVLVDFSLLQVSAGRFRLLDTLREWGAMRVPTADQADLAGRHLARYGRLMHEWSSLIQSGQPLPDDDYLSELDNCHAAVSHGVKIGASESAELVYILGLVFVAKGKSGELTPLAQHLVTDPNLQPEGRVRLLHLMALDSWAQGDPDSLKDLSRQLHETGRDSNNPYAMRLAHSLLALRFHLLGDSEAAASEYQSALDIASQAGDTSGQAAVLNNLALVAFDEGRLDEAADLAQSSLALARLTRDQRLLVRVLDSTARIELSRGRHRIAAGCLLEQLALAEAIHDDVMTSVGLQVGSQIAISEGLIDASLLLGLLGRRFMAETQHRYWVSRWETSAEDAVLLARSRLSSDQVQAVERRAQRMTLTEARSFVIDRLSARPRLSDLTARELEVTRLVAQGRTNAQIALGLGISIRTVEAHCEHIRTKLAVHSRVEMATWYLRQDLSSVDKAEA